MNYCETCIHLLDDAFCLANKCKHHPSLTPGIDVVEVGEAYDRAFRRRMEYAQEIKNNTDNIMLGRIYR